MPTSWEPVLQLGVSGVLLLVLWLVVNRGDLRTRFEADAWRDRSKRAEDQVDRLIPAIEALNDTVHTMVEQNKLMLEAFQRFMDRVENIRLLPPEQPRR